MPSGALVNGECVCDELRSDCPYSTVREFCAQISQGCPESIDTWLECASAGQLSTPGNRDGYHLVRCDGGYVVYYVYGFGDSVRWIYDSDGRLIGLHRLGDDGTYASCGASAYTCDSHDHDELLSPLFGAAGAAGAAGGGGTAGAAGGEMLPVCAKL
jgi:hypothetical protein